MHKNSNGLKKVSIYGSIPMSVKAIDGKMNDTSLKSTWQDLILGIIDEEKVYYEFANRNIPKYAMGVLRQIALTGIVAAPYSAAFAKACDLTPGRIQNAIKLLLKEDKILEVESGIKVMDPLERVCLIVLGQDRVSQAESLNAVIGDLTEEKEDQGD
jgi:hypothetical protein